VLAPYIYYEIVDDNFFIQIDSSEKEVKTLEKQIKAAIKSDN